MQLLPMHHPSPLLDTSHSLGQRVRHVVESSSERNDSRAISWRPKLEGQDRAKCFDGNANGDWRRTDEWLVGRNGKTDDCFSSSFLPSNSTHFFLAREDQQ